MRNAGQQRTERGKFFALIQRFTLSCQLCRGALLFGDVASDGQHMRFALILHRDAMYLQFQCGAILAQVRHLCVTRFAGGDRAEKLGVVGRALPAAGRQRGKLIVAIAVHPPKGGIGIDDLAFSVPQRQPIDRCTEHRVILFLARPQCRFGRLAVGNVARERQYSVFPADGDALDENIMPTQAVILALAKPFNAQRLSGGCTRDQSHRVLLGIWALPGTECSNIESSELVTVVAEGDTGFVIDIHDGAGFDVMDENAILGGIENRSIACLRDTQSLRRPHALGNVLA